jgi:hypothetical protein
MRLQGFPENALPRPPRRGLGRKEEKTAMCELGKSRSTLENAELARLVAATVRDATDSTRQRPG